MFVYVCACVCVCVWKEGGRNGHWTFSLHIIMECDLCHIHSQKRENLKHAKSQVNILVQYMYLLHGSLYNHLNAGW